MAKKSKKNINQFKEALFSNTDFLKKTEISEDTKQITEIVSKDVIDSEVREKFKLLANFEKTDEKELINKALNHYLRLKGLQLEQAMKDSLK